MLLSPIPDEVVVEYELWDRLLANRIGRLASTLKRDVIW
jgi:hypothetical protein